ANPARIRSVPQGHRPLSRPGRTLPPHRSAGLCPVCQARGTAATGRLVTTGPCSSPAHPRPSARATLPLLRSLPLVVGIPFRRLDGLVLPARRRGELRLRDDRLGRREPRLPLCLRSRTGLLSPRRPSSLRVGAVACSRGEGLSRLRGRFGPEFP